MLERDRALSVFLLGGLALASASFAADWPQFRGPNRDGVSNETGLASSWPEGGPKQVFRVALGGGYSGVSVSKGRVYTMCNRATDEFVVSLDADSGQEVWAVRVGRTWQDQFGDGPRSTPTVDSGVVFALGSRGKLVALGAADGVEIWARDLKADYQAEPPSWGMATSPLVEGDALLVNVGGDGGSSVVAFDRKTGKEIWRSQADPAGYAAPIAITVGGVRQVVFFTGTRVVSLAPRDGSLLWARPWKTDYDVNAATPVFVPPDRLFVSSGYDVGGALLRLRVVEGRPAIEELWKNREMKNKFSSSVLVGDSLYGFDEGTLKCVDVATGKTRWQERGFGHGSLIAAGGRLFVLGDEGTLALVDATPEAYRERSRSRPFQGKTWTLPTLAGGRLFLRNEKEIVAFDVSG